MKWFVGGNLTWRQVISLTSAMKETTIQYLSIVGVRYLLCCAALFSRVGSLICAKDNKNVTSCFSCLCPWNPTLLCTRNKLQGTN